MTIAVAVDRSDRATQAVEEAGRLAAAFDDEVHVVHVLGRSESSSSGGLEPRPATQWTSRTCGLSFR